MSFSATPNFSFEQTEVTTRQYQLDPNDAYEYPAPSSIQPLRTCPLTSEIVVVDAPWTSGGNFRWDKQFGKTQFVSNCIKFHISLPVTVTINAANPPTGPDITKDNFITELLADGGDLCYSQYSLLQALSSVGVSLNNQKVFDTNNVAETFNMVAPYYAASDTDEWFHASQPDRYQKFEAYSGANTKIEFFNELNVKSTTFIHPDSESNIFVNKMAKGYVSRVPQWTWGSQTATPKVSANLICNVFCYLPLSIGSVPDQSTALSGIHRLAVEFTLKTSPCNYIFNMLGNRYKDITINVNGGGDLVKSSMLVQVLSAPQYMRDRMIDKRTGLMQPYSLGFPRLLNTVGNSMIVDGAAEPNFNLSNISTGVVPKAIYIAMVKVKDGTWAQCAKTPINFGLISQLSISVESALTSFNTILQLDHLTNCNGYDGLDPLGKLIAGFPIKIDLGKDISLPGDMIIGQSMNFNFSVQGKFRNQGDSQALYQLHVVTVTDSTLDFDGAEFSQSSGVLLDSSMLRNEHFLKDQYSLYQRKVNVLGGGFMDGIKWLGRNAFSLGKKLWENRDAIAKTVGDVVGLVKTVRGGKIAQANTSAAGNVRTLAAGDVKKALFK